MILMTFFSIHDLIPGDALMGRGFMGKVAMDEHGHLERLENDESRAVVEDQENGVPPKAASYWEVISDPKTFILCLTGFFFQYVPRPFGLQLHRLFVFFVVLIIFSLFFQFCQRECPFGFGRTHGRRR